MWLAGGVTLVVLAGVGVLVGSFIRTGMGSSAPWTGVDRRRHPR